MPKVINQFLSSVSSSPVSQLFNMLRLFCLVILCTTLASAVHVDKCREIFGAKDGSFGAGKIEDVRVGEKDGVGCSDTPCKLRKGATYTIEIDFVPDKPYKELTTAVYGGIGIIRVPFREIHGTNACKDVRRMKDGKRGCPLQVGELYTYRNSFPILKSYPAVNVQVQYGLNDGNNPVVCFNLPSKISN